MLHSFNIHDRNTELQAGFNRICSLLKINPTRIPTDGNNYGRTKYPVDWKQGTIDRLRYKYKEEIERFGFKEPFIKDA